MLIVYKSTAYLNFIRIA